MRSSLIALLVLVLTACDSPSKPTGSSSSPGASSAVRPTETPPTRTTPPPEHPTTAHGPSTKDPAPVNVADILIGDRREQDPRETETDQQNVGDVRLTPDAWDPASFVRPRKRLTVAAISQAMRDATGGPGWQDPGNNYRDRWLASSNTLGVPDYLTRVTADRRPSPTFTKFLRDAAIDVCTELMWTEMDPNVPEAERDFMAGVDRDTLPEDNAATRAHLSTLIMRAHGTRVAVDAPEMDRWIQFIENVAETNREPIAVWRGVCIALFIHPRFYIY